MVNKERRTIQRGDITAEVQILMSMSCIGLRATVEHCRNSSSACHKGGAVDIVFYVCNIVSAGANSSRSRNLWPRLSLLCWSDAGEALQ